MSAYEIFEKHVARAHTLMNVSARVSYDMMCCAARDGADEIAAEQAELEGLVFDELHCDEYISALCELREDPSGLDQYQKRLVEVCYRQYENEKNIPRDFAVAAAEARQSAYDVWLRAKEASDFSIFAPALKKVVEITRAEIDFRDKKYKTYYDACLADYEFGSSVEKHDAFFEELKKVFPLIASKAASSKKPDPVVRVTIPEHIQKDMAYELLALEGLRSSSLSFNLTEHPFTDFYCAGDVRVTSHIYPEEPMSNVYSVLHEGGHALFMMYMPEVLHKNHLASEPSAAMHETISRFYENVIGRSRAF
ncbi:MAG: hypothetical protein K6C36_10060, partial [Clostridia bacterium]|nr:hypothetical protein [Clostridia bacterium]